MSEEFQEAMKEGKIQDTSQKPKKKSAYDKALTPSDELSDKHLQDLLKSGLDIETINEAGIKSSLNNDALVIPIWDIHKKILRGGRARYNDEVIEANKYSSSEGKTPKYRPSEGLSNVLFFPHIKGINCVKIAEDISVPIFITEGEKKALKLTLEGYFCIGLFGVNNWVSKKIKKEKDVSGGEAEVEVSEPIEDFNLIKWKNRVVYLVFDSDKFKNKAVLHAEGELWNYLKNVLGADARVINLPDEPGVKGVDDFFIKQRENGKKKFEELIEKATPVSLGYLILCDKSRRKKQEMPHYLAQFICKTKSILSTNTGLLIYEDGFYKTLPKDERVKKIAMDYLQIAGVVPTPHLLAETVKMIETLSFNSNELVNPTNMHNVANGTLVINLTNSEINLIPHSDKNVFTYKAEVEYLPDTNTKQVRDFLNSTIPDENQQVIALETLGFGMFPELRQHIEFAKITLLQGEGNNGKTIFTGFSKRIIGNDACSSTSLDQLLNKDNRFMPITLYKKKANFSTENDSILIKENSILKAITSGKPGDELTIEQKHKPAFPALVNPVLMMALNKEIALPANRTFALERRIQIVNFPIKFSKNPKEGEAQADNRLENYEYTKPIVNGLLILVLEAIKEMIKRGSIWQDGVAENLKKAILKGSHKERFIDEYIKLDPEAQETSEDIHTAYVKHCLEEGLAQEHQNQNKTVRIIWLTEKYDDACRTPAALSKYLKSRFKKQIEDTFISLSDGRRIRGFKGIRLASKKVEDEPFNCAEQIKSKVRGCIDTEQIKNSNLFNESKQINIDLHRYTDDHELSSAKKAKPELLEVLKQEDAAKHN